MNACLLCLEKKRNHLRVFSKKGSKLKCSYIISKHFWLKINPKKNSQEYICDDCWNVLLPFHHFYQSVAERHNYLECEINIETDYFPESTKEMKIEETYLKCLPKIEVIENSNNCIENLLRCRSVPQATVQNLVKNEDENSVQESVNTFDNDSDMDLPLSTFLPKLQSGLNAEHISDAFNDKSSVLCEIAFQPVNEQAKSLSNEIECVDLNDVGDSTKIQLYTSQSVLWNVKRTSSCENSPIFKNDFNSKLKEVNDPIDEFVTVKCKSQMKSAILKSQTKKKYLKTKTTQQNKFDEKIGKFFENFKCAICSLLVENFNELKYHMVKIHNSTPSVECCKRKFTTRRQLYNHVLTHLNVFNFKCYKCAKTFKDNRALQEHFDRHHQCGKCSKIFPNRKNLREHQIVVHLPISEYKFSCTECDAKFPLKRKQRDHLRSAHGLESPVVCDKCGKHFRNLYSLKIHMVSHTEYSYLMTDPVQCKDCGKWLKHKNNLNAHKYYVHGRRVQCKICEKTFKTSRELRAHINVHTKAEVYNCKVCSKNFTRKATLREHVKNIHSGKRARVQCGVCDVWFSCSNTLKTHLKTIHAKSDGCACPVCGRISVHQLALRRHIKRHHGDHSMYGSKGEIENTEFKQSV